MRPDQLERLKDVQGRLVEVVLNDADPQNWTASDKLLLDMDQQERGDAKWCRQVAVQSVALLFRVQQLLEPKDRGPTAAPYLDPEDDIKKAERMASDALARIGQHASAR